jgi:hypothetical protein
VRGRIDFDYPIFIRFLIRILCQNPLATAAAKGYISTTTGTEALREDAEEFHHSGDGTLLTVTA